MNQVSLWGIPLRGDLFRKRIDLKNVLYCIEIKTELY